MLLMCLRPVQTVPCPVFEIFRDESSFVSDVSDDRVTLNDSHSVDLEQRNLTKQQLPIYPRE